MTRIETHWQVLFDHAMHLLDELPLRARSPQEWTFGGGTAMMLQINHRLSFDVDFFTADLQMPEQLRDLVKDRYVDPGQGYKVGDNYIKIVFSGLGKIDFITANSILADHARPKTVRGRKVMLETVPEIIAKKVFHRGHNIVPRDIYDIAAACHAGLRDEIMAVLRQMPDRLDVFATTLNIIRQEPAKTKEQIDDIVILPGFEHVQAMALEIVEELVVDTRNTLTPSGLRM